MPSPYIRSLSKETGKPEAEIEKLWNKAKDITSDTFGKPEDDFGSKEYKYTVGIVKNMLGLDEKVLDPTYFLKSGKTAKEFIETLTSAQFTIGDVNPVSVSREIGGDDEDDEKDEGSSVVDTLPPVPNGSADIGDEYLPDHTGEEVDDDSNWNNDGVILPPDDFYEELEKGNR